MPKVTIRYTRPEVLAGTEIRTGALLRFAVTYEVEDAKQALIEFREEYGNSDARITSYAIHPEIPATVHLLPTQIARAYYGQNGEVS